jgi:hypothetical protein
LAECGLLVPLEFRAIVAVAVFGRSGGIQGVKKWRQRKAHPKMGALLHIRAASNEFKSNKGFLVEVS